jgi:hypothetical protein
MHVDEMLVYFDTSSGYNVNDEGAESVVMKTSDSETIWVDVMVTELADSTKLQCVIVNQKSHTWGAAAYIANNRVSK